MVDHPTLVIRYACKQFLDNWAELEQYCGYREDNIPQLEDINRLVLYKLLQLPSTFSKSTIYMLKRIIASNWISEKF